jgi:hypothetical protein
MVEHQSHIQYLVFVDLAQLHCLALLARLKISPFFLMNNIDRGDCAEEVYTKNSKPNK